MLHNYFPDSYRARKGEEFLKLKQGNMTVREYAAKFESLSRFFRLFKDGVDEVFMCSHFQEGLNWEL